MMVKVMGEDVILICSSLQPPVPDLFIVPMSLQMDS